MWKKKDPRIFGLGYGSHQIVMPTPTRASISIRAMAGAGVLARIPQALEQNSDDPYLVRE